MRIRLEHDGSVFEYERRPMRSSRFRALWAIAAGALYVFLVWGVAALCGLMGVLVVAIATILVSAIFAI